MPGFVLFCGGLWWRGTIRLLEELRGTLIMFGPLLGSMFFSGVGDKFFL